jgi:hypothetical protein
VPEGSILTENSVVLKKQKVGELHMEDTDIFVFSLVAPDEFLLETVTPAISVDWGHPPSYSVNTDGVFQRSDPQLPHSSPSSAEVKKA